MNRRKSREQAFALMFENTFKTEEPAEIINMWEYSKSEKLSDFSKELFEGAFKNSGNIDIYIEKNIRGWEKTRLSRIVISILRLAIFEMLYQKDTPSSVAINEAVELAKKYATQEDASYINGVLGSVSKDLGDAGEKQSD